MTWLDIAANVLGALGAIAALLGTLRFTKPQRKRYPLLRRLDGKQVWLLSVGLPSIVFAVVFNLAAKSRPFREQSETPSGLSVSRATTAGFEADLSKRVSGRADEARDYFAAGERDFTAGRYAQAAVNYERSIAAVATIPASINLGVSREYISEYQAALAAFGAALQMLVPIQDREYEVVISTHLAVVYNDQGSNDQALSLATRALQAATATKDQILIADALVVLGRIQDAKGNAQGSVATLATALEKYRARGSREGEAAALNNLGSAFIDLGKIAEALKSYRDADGIYQDLNIPRGRMLALMNIGNAQADLGNFAEALKAYEEGRVLAGQVGSRKSEANALNNIGEVERQQSRLAQALDHAGAAFDIYKEIGSPDGQASALTTLGNAHFMKGDYEAALDNFKRASELFRQAGDPLGESNATGNAAEVLREWKRFDESLAMANKALSGFITIGNLQGQANTYITLGSTYLTLKRYPQALQAFDTALGIATRSGDRPRQATAIAGQGEVFLDTHRLTESLERSATALNLFQSLKDPNGEAGALANSGLAHEQQGNKADALRELSRALELYRANGIETAGIKAIEQAISRLKRP